MITQSSPNAPSSAPYSSTITTPTPATTAPQNEVRNQSSATKHCKNSSNNIWPSVPLPPPPSNLHVHRRRRNPHLLPPQTHRLATRKTHRPTLRPRLLAPGPRLSDFRSCELHQNCVSLRTEAGNCADGGGDAGRVYGCGDGDCGGLCVVFEYECWGGGEEGSVGGFVDSENMGY